MISIDIDTLIIYGFVVFIAGAVVGYFIKSLDEKE